MKSLRQFFGSRDDVPAWARFFQPGAFRAFLEALDVELTRRAIPYEMGDGVVRRTGGEPQEYGVINLAQICNQAPREKWPALVTDHFDRIERSRSEADGLDDLGREFERARPLLKVRLYPSDFPTPPGAVSRMLAPGLVAALVYDLPTAIALVPADHIKAWGRPTDDLFSVGLDNVRAEGPITPQATDVGGATIHAMLGSSFFVASRALLLEGIVKATPFGAAVAIPHRHAVLYHAIEDRRAVAAIQAMLPAAFGMFQEGPGSVTPNLYWWRPSGFTHLPARVTAKSIEFAPPSEFVDLVLNRLA